MTDESQIRSRFWNKLFQDSGFEADFNQNLEGHSGLIHEFPVVAFNQDESALAVTVADPDPVKARLIGFDVEAKLSKPVTVVRPSLIDTRDIIHKVVSKFVELQMEGKKFNDYMEEVKSYFENIDVASDPSLENILNSSEDLIFRDLARSLLLSRDIMDGGLVVSLLQSVREAFLMEIHQIVGFNDFSDFTPQRGLQIINEISTRQPYTRDTLAGLCALRFAEFNTNTWRVFLDESESQEVTSELKSLGIHQFFRPPADQTALMLAETGALNEQNLVDVTEVLETFGLRNGENEIVQKDLKLSDVISTLSKQKYVIEGEVEEQITPEGRHQRALVRFKPREATFFKILKHVPYIEKLRKIFISESSDSGQA